MRPEHSETKAKTECTTKTKTEAKNMLWDQDQILRDRGRGRDQYGQLNCTWK